MHTDQDSPASAEDDLKAGISHLKARISHLKTRISHLKVRMVADKEKTLALHDQLLQTRALMRDQEARARGVLKDRRSRTWAANKAILKLIEHVFGETIDFDQSTRFEPVSPELIKRLVKSKPLKGDLFASLIQGKDLANELLSASRTLIASKQIYKATSLAHSLLRSDETLDVAQIAMALACLSNQRWDSAFLFFDRASREFVRRHALAEFVDTAYRVQSDQARAEVGLLAEAGQSQQSSAAVRLAVAMSAYAFGDRDLGFKIARDLAADKLALAAVTDEQARDLDWFLSFGRSRAAAKATRSTMTGPCLAIYDYKSADRAHTSSNVGDYIQTLAFLTNIARVEQLVVHGDPDFVHFMQGLKGRIRPSMRLEGAPRQATLMTVDRDCSRDHDIPPGTWLVAFGWHMHNAFRGQFQFPFHHNLEPIFISFHIKDPKLLTTEAIEYLRRYGPIGCRDWSTVYLLTGLGVPAFFSGCLSVTLDAAFEPLPHWSATTDQLRASMFPLESRTRPMVSDKASTVDPPGFGKRVLSRILNLPSLTSMVSETMPPKLRRRVSIAPFPAAPSESRCRSCRRIPQIRVSTG
jgi:hypothetical protein